MTQDAMDIEETLRQLQLDSLRRLAERLRNELDEVRKDRDAWRSRAAETAGAKPETDERAFTAMSAAMPGSYSASVNVQQR